MIASGSSGMAVNFSEKSTQGSILQTVDAATGTITLTDESGNVILSMDTDKQFNSVLVSSPQIVKDSTYTLTTGGKETSIQMSSLVMGSGGTGGMRGGGRMSRERMETETGHSGIDRIRVPCLRCLPMEMVR